MKKIFQILTLCAGIVLSAASHADYSFEEIQNLKNDKEVVISSFNEKERKRILTNYNDRAFNEGLASVIYSTILEFVNENEKLCELNLIERLKSNLEKDGFSNKNKDIQEYLKILRVNNSIDDILYEILASVTDDYFGLLSVDINKKPAGYFLERKYLNERNNIPKLFSNFDEWPDEVSLCSYEEYAYIKNNIWISETKKSNKPKHLKVMFMKAFEEKAISLESYNKLEFLRGNSNLNERNLWLKDYLRIVLHAKNKMVPLNQDYVPNSIDKEDNFASERLRRFSALTRRKLLYQKYNETQIIQLAQIIQKASRRMGVDPDVESSTPVIIQEFEIILAGGKRENYIERIELDPQSQYNLARRLMRKDMVELQMMSNFVNVKITHQDLVMAAFETGYITFEDLEFVVQYDDLWNPEMSKWERISGFIFKVAGYSNFFIPPPFNVATSIAIGIIEGIVDDKFFRNGANNDNPATFIE